MIEDLYPYSRVHEMFYQLTPKDFKAQLRIYSLGARHGADPRAPLEVFSIANGDTVTVSLQLLSGLLQSGKFWPLRFSPIRIEVELANPGECCVTGNGAVIQDRVAAGGALGAVTERFTQHYEIQDARIHCDIITLDTGLQEQFNKLLLNNGVLTLHGNQYITTSQAILGDNPLVSVTRGMSRLRQIMWSFERNRDPAANHTLSVCNDFVHPLRNQGIRTGTLTDRKSYECWWQIGPKRLPEQPLRYVNEYWAHLNKVFGLSWDREEPLDVTWQEYTSDKHIGAIDCERALGVGFTGLNTKASGDLLTVQFNGLRMSADWGGPAAANQIIVRQLHIVLVAEMIIEIRQTGTTVLE